MSLPPAVKRAALEAASRSGLNRALRCAFRQSLTVLCYHGVVSDEHPSDPSHRNTVGAREFQWQMEWLARNFSPVAVRDVLAWAEGRARLPDRAALVTFDDGYSNNLRAASLMERCGVPAAIFVTTGYVGSSRVLWPEELRRRVLHWPGPRLPMPAGDPDRVFDPAAAASTAEALRRRCKRLPPESVAAYLDRLRETPLPDWNSDEELLGFLSWDEVRDLRRRGFEIGSHTVEHVIMTQAGESRLLREAAESRAAIERETGCGCVSVAYPNGGSGDFDSRVIRVCRDAGYRLGFTLTGRLNRGGEDPLAFSRLHVPGHVPRAQFEAKISGLYALVGRG